AHPTPLRTRSGLVYTHFAGAPPFREAARSPRARFEAGPYPDEWAAVHHVLPDHGWVYALRFDDGRVSAGALLADPEAHEGLARGEGEGVWRALLDAYPGLARVFGRARPLRPFAAAPRLQRRRHTAVGEGWAALPHAYAFVDPLFSTGIAWSLRGVERLADALLSEGPGRRERALGRYEDLVAREVERIDRLVAAAYAARGDFALFGAHAMLYFVAVSWAETRERLFAGETSCWDGFLGVGDPLLDGAFEEGAARVTALVGDGPPRALPRDVVAGHHRWLADVLAPRNVAGLLDESRRNLYPADLEVVVDRAPLVGLSPEAMRARLPDLMRL
ncbi:MAG: hypothetical protein D6701_10895, partial [Gemmatimonadetes bacterium]